MATDRMPVEPTAKTFVVWWAQLDRMLRDDDLHEACLAVARPYFDLGMTPLQAYVAEAAVQSRMLAA